MKNSFYRFLLYGFIIFLFFVMLFSFVFTNKKLTKDISSNVSGFVTKVDSVVSVPFTALSKSHNAVSYTHLVRSFTLLFLDKSREEILLNSIIKKEN